MHRARVQRRNFPLLFASFLLLAAADVHAAESSPAKEKMLRAGAFAIDITPEQLPVLVNGGMTTRSADKIVDRLHARCLVLDDGTNQIAIVVVDSCMLPRSLLDEAKEIAAKATGIPTNRMLISATHTHSAPSAMGALGTDADEAYVKFLPDRIARGIALAQKNLEPARIGWASEREPKNIYCRHWLMKEGTAQTNPFSGKSNDQVQMNPGNGNPNKIKPISPVDDEVSVVSVQAKDGRPIALLANYSTHYAGSPALSADYFGVFAEKIGKLIDADAVKDKPAFVGILSNGTSGDANCLDFSLPEPRKFDYFSVAEDTAQAALAAYRSIKYYDWVPIVMEEGLLPVDVRMPTADEVAKAKEFLQTEEGKKLQTIPAVYARETVLLSEVPPTRELKIQAIRLGELGIGTMPNEVYNITGLNIKKDSPLRRTFCIELANGAEGYIPPPDQHKLGGYTTWRARTSLLEEEAEPTIRANVLELLGKVAEQRHDEAAVPVVENENSFRAGVYAIDITPAKFPVIVSGNFTEQTAGSAHGKLHARCLMLDDGRERIAIVVVDNLMIPRELIDEAKQLAAKSTGIRADRIMVSATHTHSAPSAMGCLGSRTDPEYPAQLVPAIARSVELAMKNLQPAKLGYTAVDAPTLTNCRRWIRRPDAIGADPFGEPTIRAMMHPGYQNPSYVGPAGPVDSQLSLVAIQTADGAPLAVLANYSMHYFGSAPVSADYFGAFCEKLEAKIGKRMRRFPSSAFSRKAPAATCTGWTIRSRRSRSHSTAIRSNSPTSP